MGNECGGDAGEGKPRHLGGAKGQGNTRVRKEGKRRQQISALVPQAGNADNEILLALRGVAFKNKSSQELTLESHETAFE